MFGSNYHHGDTRSGETYRLRWPETGGIRTVLELALLYHLITIATPVLIEQVELLNPAIVPEPFTTALYALVWLLIGAVMAWLLLTDAFVSTYRFDDADSFVEHLEETTEDRRWILKNGGIAATGGILAWVTYTGFVEAFLGVVDMLVIVVDDFQWTLGVVDGLYITGFLGGFALFAIGVDRLIVAGLWRYIQRRSVTG